MEWESRSGRTGNQRGLVLNHAVVAGRSFTSVEAHEGIRMESAST